MVVNQTTLTGAGQVTLSDSADTRISGAGPTATLNPAGAIAGAGQLGDGQLTFDNLAGGVVDATGSSNALVLNMGAGSLVNSGLLEATGSAGLFIQGGAVGGAGTILAASGSTVLLEGVTLQGGTLTTAGTGVIEVTSNATLNGSAAAVVNNGTLNVTDSAELSIQGSITNAGVIALDATSDFTTLLVSANATLAGAGQVTLSDSADNRILGSTALDTLSNAGAIAGAGQLGDGQLTFDNLASGVVDATGANALVMNMGCRIAGQQWTY